jgi:hypothetical protein
MPKKIRKILPYLSEPTHNFYGAWEGGATAGVTYACHALPELYRACLREIKGRLTRGELQMVLDVMNGTICGPDAVGWSVAANIEDGFILYPGMYEGKWGVKKTAMLEKIKALTAAQLWALEVWAMLFWAHEPRDIDRAVEGLL